MNENPRHQLAALREQLLALADEVAPFATPPKPDKISPPTSSRTGGPVWAVAQHPKNGREFAALQVHCEDGDAGVFIEGANFSYGGDWHALSTTEARSFALALLAAAAWADRQDEIGQRRARKTGEAS